MPLKPNPICIQCKKDESPMWTNAETLGALCLDCVRAAKEESERSAEIKEEMEDNDDASSTTTTAATNECNSKSDICSGGGRGGPNRRSSKRFYKTRLNPFALPKTQTPKGRGRRVIFKKTPMKAPTAVATPVTSDSVFYNGMYFQIGDVVSVLDLEGETYYAQIRGFLTDQYCEKSAVITWLLPTLDSPKPEDAFDPATYILGPEEEIPRKMDGMEFIMHAPSDYYKAKDTPYPKVTVPPSPGFIWTSLESIKRLKDYEHVL